MMTHQDLSRFDGVEINFVVQSPEDEFCEPVFDATEPRDPHARYFWSVYLRYDANNPKNDKFRGAEWVADFDSEEEAAAYARKLEKAMRAASL